MDAAAIQVLHRETGYLRLRLPPELRHPSAGRAIEDGLRGLAGVLRVTLLTAEGKLAVRFDPYLCGPGQVAQRLKSLLPELPVVAVPAPAAAESAEPRPAAHLGERLAQLRGQVVAAMPERFQPVVESAMTEKAVTNFFNDIVAFYLIKTHWDLIVKLWIRDPIKYGNAWLTVFYLVFLLVRYRKS